ncbi:hypothetical protein HYV80_01685 [Candidatus Woesearchaeota archaeon]|nr:hypothetical protein [Candidatus Woesearchaeota archaeon]
MSETYAPAVGGKIENMSGSFIGDIPLARRVGYVEYAGNGNRDGKTIDGIIAKSQTESEQMRRHGYAVISETQFEEYSGHSLNLALPDGNNRGVVFVPKEQKPDEAIQFKAIFLNLSGLHSSYANLKDENVKGNMRAYATYAIPDGVKILMAPAPNVIDARTGKQI